MDEWVDRFMGKLGALVPSMTPDDAFERARQMFSEADDIEPDEAAEIYALDLPPADPSAPGD
jgi:hypothetical protein